MAICGRFFRQRREDEGRKTCLLERDRRDCSKHEALSVVVGNIRSKGGYEECPLQLLKLMFQFCLPASGHSRNLSSDGGNAVGTRPKASERASVFERGLKQAAEDEEFFD